jgi:hypothetical protein
MKDKYRGWYTRDAAEVAAIWDQAIFVPDANVLLHCLRHPANVRDELLRIFDVVRDSLWIPYQVGLEFHRNRLDVEFGAQDMYQRLTSDYETIFNQAREKLKQLRAHPVIDVDRELAAANTFLDDFKGRMEADAQAHPTQEIQAAVDRLTVLLEGRVGEKWAPEQLAAVKKEGEDRYARKVPPGFMDAKKDNDQKFGDLIIWKDMITKAQAAQRPVIFVSDDVKEDWWWIHRGRKLGPRPELVEEFHAATGQDFHIYEFSNFLRIAGERNQEIQGGVEVVEKSLLVDERAKRRQRESENALELSVEISSLEDEREQIIQTLSGSPGLEIDRATIDRSTLRARLEHINAKIAKLSNSPITDSSIGSIGDDRGDS